MLIPSTVDRKDSLRRAVDWVSKYEKTMTPIFKVSTSIRESVGSTMKSTTAAVQSVKDSTIGRAYEWSRDQKLQGEKDRMNKIIEAALREAQEGGPGAATEHGVEGVEGGGGSGSGGEGGGDGSASPEEEAEEMEAGVPEPAPAPVAKPPPKPKWSAFSSMMTAVMGASVGEEEEEEEEDWFCKSPKPLELELQVRRAAACRGAALPHQTQRHALTPLHAASTDCMH